MPKPYLRLQKIIAIVGQTSTGKSDIAVSIARKVGGEIVSADSRQVYRGLDLVSGKISVSEMRGIRHHCLDIASPKRIFSVAQFEHHARRAINDIARRGKLPIVCGGSGLYVAVALGQISLPAVPPNRALRAKLNKQDRDTLLQQLAFIDEKRASTIDKNKRRIVRAIEIAHAMPSSQKKADQPRYDVCVIGLTVPRDELRKRIYARLLQREKQGMLQEIKKLRAQGISWKRLDALGLECREIARYLRKEVSKQTMLDNLFIAIVHFARRQETWFKKNPAIVWFSPHEEHRIFQVIEQFLKND